MYSKCTGKIGHGIVAARTSFERYDFSLGLSLYHIHSHHQTHNSLETYRGYEDIMASRLYLKYRKKECAKLLAFVKELHFEGQIERRHSKKWAAKARRKYGFGDTEEGMKVIKSTKERRGSVLRQTPSQAHMKLHRGESYTELHPSNPAPYSNSNSNVPVPLSTPVPTTGAEYFTSDEHQFPGQRSRTYTVIDRVDSADAAVPSSVELQRRRSLIDHIDLEKVVF